MSKTKIIHIKKQPDLTKHPDYRYIGRGGKFGNPFSHLDSSISLVRVENRDEAVDFHKKWLNGEMKVVIDNPSVENEKMELKPPTREEIISELGGKILGCFCVPKRCHGQNFIDIIETNLNFMDMDLF